MLEVRSLSKAFDGVAAVDGVDLAVGAGESVGLVGPNGAGKTTLFNCIGGQLRPDSGTVLVDGREVTTMSTWRRARLGIGRTYQRLELFGAMTVRDHLIVAERASRREGRLWRDLCNLSAPSPGELARVRAVAELVGVDDVVDVPVSALSLGTCRLVELGRALAGEPRLLLADEPSSGLDEHESGELASVLRALQAERGTAVLLVEHDLGMVEAAVDRVVVMDVGAVVAEGTFAAVMASPAVRHAYLGTP